MAQVQQGGTPKNTTSTVALTASPCTMIGYHVNSTSGGTLVFRDGGASGTAISGTITPAVGFNAFPATFQTSAHVTISGTIDVTFFVS